MELAQLKTFAVVARTLHFTEAARELQLTQPAVSYQIKSLEKELGESLFVRAKNNIALTKKGELVLKYAKKIFDQIDLIQIDIGPPKTCAVETFRIVAITRALGAPFHQLRDAWVKQSGVELSFEAAMISDSVIDLVLDGSADLGFTSLTGEFEGLIDVGQCEFDMNLVFGKDDPLYGKETVTFEELKYKNWILFDEGSWLRRETDRMFADHGFVPSNIYECNDGSIVKDIVKKGDKVTILPSWGITEEVASGDLGTARVFDCDDVIVLRLIVKDTNVSPLIEQFVDCISGLQLEGLRTAKKTLTVHSR